MAARADNAAGRGIRARFGSTAMNAPTGASAAPGAKAFDGTWGYAHSSVASSDTNLVCDWTEVRPARLGDHTTNTPRSSP